MSLHDRAIATRGSAIQSIFTWVRIGQNLRLRVATSCVSVGTRPWSCGVVP